jgi:hypothetical protein
MTPRQYIEESKALELKAVEGAEGWHHPLSKGNSLLHNVLDSMSQFKLKQEEVPLVIKLVENPKHKTSKLFTGAVDLFTHDCIHVVLGRGLLPKDEAFVIGYTMGSSKKMKRWRRNLFMFICKYLYNSSFNCIWKYHYLSKLLGCFFWLYCSIVKYYLTYFYTLE